MVAIRHINVVTSVYTLGSELFSASFPAPTGLHSTSKRTFCSPSIGDASGVEGDEHDVVDDVSESPEDGAPENGTGAGNPATADSVQGGNSATNGSGHTPPSSGGSGSTPSRQKSASSTTPRADKRGIKTGGGDPNAVLPSKDEEITQLAKEPETPKPVRKELNEEWLPAFGTMRPVIESADASNMLEKRIRAKCFLESKDNDTSSPTIAMRSHQALETQEGKIASRMLKMWEPLSQKFIDSVFKYMSYIHPLQDSHLARWNSFLLQNKLLASLMCKELILHFQFGLAYVFVGLASACHELTYALPLYHSDGTCINFSEDGDGAEGTTDLRMEFEYSMPGTSVLSVSTNGGTKSKDLYGVTEVSFNDPKPSEIPEQHSSVKDGANPFTFAGLFGIDLSIEMSKIERVTVSQSTSVDVKDNAGKKVVGRASRATHVTQDLNEGIFSNSGFILSCYSLFHLRGLGMKWDSPECEALCNYLMCQLLSILNSLPTKEVDNPIVSATVVIKWKLPKKMVTLKEVAMSGKFRPNSALHWAIVKDGAKADVISRFAKYIVMSSMINVNFHPSLVYLIPFSHVGTNNTYSYFMTNRTFDSWSTVYKGGASPWSNDVPLIKDPRCRIVDEMIVRQFTQDWVPANMPFVTRRGLRFAEISLMDLDISAEIRDYTSFQCGDDVNLKHIQTEFVKEIVLMEENEVLRPSVSLSTGPVGAIGYRIF